MGWYSTLRGEVTLSEQAYQRLMAVKTGWYDTEGTIAQYLKRYSYSPASKLFAFDAEGKLYHDESFFNILANYKDVETTDFCEVEGELYYPHTEHGWYVLQVGRWGYIADDALQYDDKPPPRKRINELVGRWYEATPLLVKAHFFDGIVDVETSDGETYQAPTAKIRDLHLIPQELRNEFQFSNGGEILIWNYGERWNARYPWIHARDIIQAGYYTGPAQ
jgi:hypothetical protein